MSMNMKLRAVAQVGATNLSVCRESLLLFIKALAGGTRKARQCVELGQLIFRYMIGLWQLMEDLPPWHPGLWFCEVSASFTFLSLVPVLCLSHSRGQGWLYMPDIWLGFGSAKMNKTQLSPWMSRVWGKTCGNKTAVDNIHKYVLIRSLWSAAPPSLLPADDLRNGAWVGQRNQRMPKRLQDELEVPQEPFAHRNYSQLCIFYYICISFIWQWYSFHQMK